MATAEADVDAAPRPAPLAGCPTPAAVRRPELLAPAGDWECARAAVENGADAIYFGLARFNARMRARNFTEADLPALMEFLHRRGVKGYVTFNTLVFANELAEAERELRALIAAGVDAALVQDAGICRLIRRLSPDFPIHASTQMTITSAAGVAFARDLGCTLVVLARENSLKEIEAIQRSFETAAPRSASGATGTRDPEPGTPNPRLPLEVFVHGALCVAYSGQCLTSEALGGRSANRGECAQACRLPYELICDGRKVCLGARHYLLSPQDLAGIELLPELVRLGVASLKIEGRLKSPQYVASITRLYRQALDDLRMTNHEFRAADESVRQAPNAHRQYAMEMAFSRGLSTGWLRGVNNQALVHGRFGKKRGVFLGDIAGVRGQSLLVRLQAPLKPGDGVVIDTGTGDDHEQGGRVYSLHPRSEVTQVCFRPGQINPRRVHAGDKLWKTDDPELNKRIRQTYEGDEVRFQRPITVTAHGHAGAPLTLIVRDEAGHVVKLPSRVPLVAAEKRPLTDAVLAQQLGRLGGTPFRLGAVENRLEGAVMLPLAELNRLRRGAVAELDRQRAQPPRWTLNPIKSSEFRVPGSELGGRGVRTPELTSNPEPRTAELIVLVRSLPQLDAALRCGVTTLYCEFEDPKKYRDAVARVRQFPPPPSALPLLFVAPPRICKPGEEWILKLVRSCEADGYLVRNYDHLDFFADCQRIGDFSLNVANPLTAEYFLSRYGLERVTASYDLNSEQLEALLQAAPPDWFEVTIHQHMPLFHMEHCVFCAFLSSGTDYTNCGRPCDRHEVKLRDRVGAAHALKADAGCRNTVFHAAAQTGAEYVERLRALGARHFRIEFVNESPAQVELTIGKYRQLLRGEISGAHLWRDLKLVHRLGVTRGPLDKA
jgi:putative protease